MLISSVVLVLEYAVSLWAGEAESEYGKIDHAPRIEVKEKLGKPTRGMKRYQKRSENQDG